MDANETKTCGVLLVGHGTRQSVGLGEFFQLERLIADLVPSFVLQSAFLELASPDIAAGIESLVAKGVQRMVVVPVLLFSAGHANRDIPLAIQQARQRYPKVEFASTEPLECHSRLLELSEQRLSEALCSANLEARDVTLVLVGRGSLDDAATAAMQRYALLLANHVSVREHRVAFMAMAQPLVESVLSEIASVDQGPVMVQPHLLFQGDLLDQLRSRTRDIAGRAGSRRFVLTGHLGPDHLLAAAFVDEIWATTSPFGRGRTR